MEEGLLPDHLPGLENEFNAGTPPHRIDLLRRIVDARGARAFDAIRPTPRWSLQPSAHVEGLAKAVLFIMVKDEEEIIAQNLEHHYRLGFRRFFILDNGSTDRTASLIASFRQSKTDAQIFYGYDYVVGYYQADKMKALELFMQVYLKHEDTPPEWLFFVDADEFITCCASEPDSVLRFNHLLGDTSKTLLVLHWAQCSSRSVIPSVPDGYDVFETFPVVWNKMTTSVPKIAYRLGHDLSPVQGNHLVEAYPFDTSTIGVLAEVDFYMLHFPQRTLAQLRRKVINGGRAYQAAKLDKSHGGHWRTYYEWYEQHGDAAMVHLLNDHIRDCVATGFEPVLPD